MNSPMFKGLLIYAAGMITYAVYQNFQEASLISRSLSIDADTELHNASASIAASCACDNDARYNVSPSDTSGNHYIAKAADCQEMVNASTESPKKDTVGAWFSKIALDHMFCNDPTANGIYVYKGTMKDGSTTFIVEAARTNWITVEDNGLSTVYYSRTLCPTICGVCGE